MQVQVHGVIFKRQRFKEADVLVKVLSQELGLFTLNVRGALRPKSKLGAATLNFSHGCYLVRTRRQGISNLQTFKSVQQYDHLFLDLVRNAYASFILDLVDHAFLEYQPLGDYYDLTILALKKLDEGQDPEIISQIVQLKLLAAYGVEPQFKKCVICGNQTGDFDYSIALGGIICSKHFATVQQRLHLTPEQTALLRTLALVPFDRLGNVNVSLELKKATRRAIDRIYAMTIDLNLKTKRFLNEMHLF